MNKIATVIIGIGIIVTLVGIFLLLGIEERAVEKIEEGVLYEGADGDMEITGVSDKDDIWFVVHIESTYEGGGEGGYNERHGNYTWNLTKEDCDLVKAFTLTHNEDGTQVFIPRCSYIEDDGGSAQDDDWIAVGTLCTQKMAGDRETKGDGCPDGTYTWDTGGKIIMVYDVGKLIEGILEVIMTALSSFGACCCGVVILLIGIILAFTMEDPQAAYSGNAQDSNLLNQDTDSMSESSSGWDEKEDYIHREKEDDEVSDENESETEAKIEAKKDAERKRSGEYELPPPPEI